MYYLFTILQLASVVGQLGLIFALLQGPFRKYLIILVYCVTRLVLLVTETLVYHYAGGASPLYSRLYWTDEAVLDLLLFLTVIMLTFQSLEGNPIGASLGKLLAIVVVAAVALPFLLFKQPYWGSRWLSQTSQLLNFGGALMNLALWTALLAGKRRDPQLLTVSAGLGIAVTGAAISWGIRLLILQSRWAADTLLSVTHVAGVFIWWWAFRPAAKARQAQLDAIAPV